MSDVKFFKINTGGRTPSELKTIIGQLDAIINELLTTALRSVSNGDISEYDIETGQTVQRVKYTNIKRVHESIYGYEKLRQYYVNKCNPRKVRLMDSKNFRR